MRNSILTSVLALLFTASLQATVYYTVKFPNDTTISKCGIVPVTSQPQINYVANCGFNVGIAQSDQIFYTNNNKTCAKILRTWTLVWWCDYNPNTYTPYYIDNPTNTDAGPWATGDSWNHGYLKYTQVIKIQDNVPPVFIGCPTGNVVFCDKTDNDPAQYNQNHVDRCEGPADLKVKVTDACSKSHITLTYRMWLDLDGNGSMETFLTSSSPNAWPVETSVSNDTLIGKVKFPTGFGLPYGTHKIEWIAQDNCAGQSVCKYEFTVKDCKAPSVVCINGLSVNIMVTGMITLWASDFLLYATDNCTPPGQLKIAIRKAGTGTGFPTNPDGTPQTGVTFTCAELGTQLVEIWALDAYGNGGYCTTFINVQDNIGACPDAPDNLVGIVATSQQKPLKDVPVSAQHNNQKMVCNTDDAGKYKVEGMPVCDLTLTPALNTKHNQGVTMHDLTLAVFHYAGATPITDPYTLIAADVNRDGQITDLDLSGIFGMAVGIDSVFAGNTSWRFVPSKFVFPAGVSPLTVPFPENISLTLPDCLQPNGDFTAIKTGDLDQSALSGNSNKGVPVSSTFFNIADRSFQAGETIQIPVNAPSLSNTLDFQFALSWLPDYLEFVSAEGGIVPSGQIARRGTGISAGWSKGFNGPHKGRSEAFTLTLRALKDGTLQDALYLDPHVIPSEVFFVDDSRTQAEISWNIGAVAARILPIQPNPARENVTIQFEMPQAGPATLTLTTADGNVLAVRKGDYAEGLNGINIDLTRRSVSGLVYVRLDSAFGTSTQAVMVENK